MLEPSALSLRRKKVVLRSLDRTPCCRENCRQGSNPPNRSQKRRSPQRCSQVCPSQPAQSQLKINSPRQQKESVHMQKVRSAHKCTCRKIETLEICHLPQTAFETLSFHQIHKLIRRPRDNIHLSPMLLLRAGWCFETSDGAPPTTAQTHEIPKRESRVVVIAVISGLRISPMLRFRS